MDESSYNYDALKSISKYMQKMEQEGDLYQHKSDFANDLIKFFHVIGIKKINYNVYNNKLGNSGKECKTERESEKIIFLVRLKF